MADHDEMPDGDETQATPAEDVHPDDDAQSLLEETQATLDSMLDDETQAMPDDDETQAMPDDDETQATPKTNDDL